MTGQTRAASCCAPAALPPAAWALIVLPPSLVTQVQGQLLQNVIKHSVCRQVIMLAADLYDRGKLGRHSQHTTA